MSEQRIICVAEDRLREFIEVLSHGVVTEEEMEALIEELENGPV